MNYPARMKMPWGITKPSFCFHVVLQRLLLLLLAAVVLYSCPDEESREDERD